MPVSDRTLDDLEGTWPEPDYDSYVLRETHRLRGVPIGEMTIENLRLLIGQGIGLDWLVPVALDILRVDPMAEGDFYPGDLLSAVSRVRVEYWQSHPHETADFEAIRQAAPPGWDAPGRSGDIPEH